MATTVLAHPNVSPLGLLTAQEPNAQLQQGMNPKEDTLYQCFTRQDLDNSGYIDLAEMRALAKQLTPQQNMVDAADMLKFADRDHDKKVSWQEFRYIMLPLTETMTDEEFQQHVDTMLGPQPHNAFNQPCYHHPQGSRARLQEQVIPVLREGLKQLLDAVVQQQLQLAAGVEWQEGPTQDEGGEPGSLYLPHGWRPFSPLRWLGEWLQGQLPPVPPTSPGPRTATATGGAAAGSSPLPSFSSMTRAEKIAIAFKHLDRDGSGFLDSHELLVVAGKLHKDQDMQYAQELLQDMDLDHNGRVELDEYCHFVMQLTEVLTDDEFDAAIHKVLGASHYSYCNTRMDKLAFLFHEIDQERCGVLSYDQVVQLAHCLDPSATPWKVQAALEAFCPHLEPSESEQPAADGASVVSAQTAPTGVLMDQFTAAMAKLLQQFSDADLDQQIIQLVEGRKLGAAVHVSDPLHEVEPMRFRELLQGMTLPDHVMQIGTMEVIDWVDGGGRVPLLLVDVRSEEEVAVSCLPAALHVPAVRNTDASLGWELGDLEPLRRRLASHLTQASRLPRLVAYCNTGERSAHASVLLSKTLGVAVRSLCGGIVNYYNQGGRVRDAQGAEVQAIHPGSPDLKPFIIRPSSFKMAT